MSGLHLVTELPVRDASGRPVTIPDVDGLPRPAVTRMYRPWPDLSWLENMTDPLGPDAAWQVPFNALHARLRLPRTADMRDCWEHVFAPWAFGFNGSTAATRIWHRHAVPPRHLCAEHHGQPVLLIDASGGWGLPATRQAFTAALAAHLEETA